MHRIRCHPEVELIMAYEDLLKSVEESAQETEQELRKNAAVVIGGIKERAKKQAEAIQKAWIDDANRSVTTERNKLRYLENVKNKEALIRTREAAFEEAFQKAKAQLNTLRANPKYPAIFLQLLREAAGTTGDDVFIIHVDPRDEALCKKTLAGLNLNGEIRADLTTAGGVMISQQGGTITISNTIESRLERAKERNRQAIHAILSGG
jgi:V/A-type H+-transporting ATPase subunit E